MSSSSPTSATSKKAVTFDPSATVGSPNAAAGDHAADGFELSASTTEAVFSDAVPRDVKMSSASGSPRTAASTSGDDPLVPTLGPEGRAAKVSVSDQGDVRRHPLDDTDEDDDEADGSRRSGLTVDVKGFERSQSSGHLVASASISDASVLVHSAKAKELDKSFVDVVAKGESRRMDEFDRREVAVKRKPDFVPVNPFQGDAIDMPDPMDDDLMGVDLSEEQTVERKQAKAFEESNHAALEHRAVAGFNFSASTSRGNLATSICHVDEASVCFAAGRHLHVAHMAEPMQHRILPRTPRCVEIVSFCISSNGKYIAVAERMPEAPHVTIYKVDTSTKIASLNFRHLTTTHVQHLCFSSNNNFLLTATAPPNQRLIMWQLSDVKVIGVLDDFAVHKHPFALPGKVKPADAIISSIAVNPWSSFLIAVGTDQGMTLWKLAGRTFNNEASVSTVVSRLGAKSPNALARDRANPEKPGLLAPVSAVCWYDEACCAALTEDGTVVAVENGVVRQRMLLNVPQPPGAIRSAVPASTSPAPSNFTPAPAGDASSASPDAGRRTPPPLGLGPSAAGGTPEPSQSVSVAQNASASFSPRFAASPGSFGSASPQQQQQQQQTKRLADPSRCPRMTHLVWASRGLLCAGEDGAVVLVDRTFAEPCFVQTCVLRLGIAPSESGRSLFPSVKACSISPGETNIAVGLDDNSLVCWSMDDMNDAITEAEREVDEAQAAAAARAEEEANRSFSGTGSPNSGDGRRRVDLFGDDDSDAPSPIGHASALKEDQSVASTFATRRQEYDSALVGDCRPGVGTVFNAPQFVNRVEHLSFHCEAVTSLSTCVQRPLIATTSTDKTLRIFDYEKNVFVVTARMEDEILAGALHPTGQFVVLCFRYYTRVYAVLQRGLHVLDDINIKPAYEARFSNGGGRIAFAVNNRVIIVDAHTYRILGGLIGHSSQVKSISFSERDEQITTTDVTGIILTWDAGTFERTSLESAQKNLIFQQALLDEQTGLYCAFGSSKHARGTTYEGEVTFVCCRPASDDTALVYVRPGMILPKGHATRKSHYQVMAITRASRALVVGTPTGRLLVYSWPILKSSKPYIAIDNHCAEITHILVSPDERYLFTVATDCTMYVYDLLHMRDGRYVSSTTFNWSLFEPVILQHTSDADQLERDAFMLRLKAEDRAADNEASLSHIQRTREAEIKALTQKSESEIDRMRKEIDVIVTAMRTHERMTTDKAHQVEASHAAAAEEIEVLYSKRAREALGRINRIDSEREELAVQYEAKIAAKRQEMIGSRQRLLSRIADRERKLHQTIATHQQKLRESVKTNEASLAQTIADYETQLLQLEVTHKATLESNDERTMRAANTASFGDREAERLRREIVDIQEEVGRKQDAASGLQHVMSRKEKENKVLKKELLAKQEAINQSEKRMLSLKLQLSKLENLRFVLTHQYEELRRAYIPKDGQIHDLESRMRDMEGELQARSFERNQVRDQVLTVDSRLDGLQQTSQSLRVKAIDQDRRSKTLIDSLGRLLDTYTDGASLLGKLKTVVADGAKALPVAKREKIGEAAVAAMSGQGAPSNDELATQVEYLEGMLLGLQKDEKRIDHDTLVHNAERIRDNTNLIETIRQMRKERKELQSRCSLAEQQLRDACVVLHRLADPRRAAAAAQPAQRLSPTSHDDESDVQPPPLLPPIGRSASALDDGERGELSLASDDDMPRRPASRTSVMTRSDGSSSAGIRSRRGLPSSKTPTPTGSAKKTPPATGGKKGPASTGGKRKKGGSAPTASTTNRATPVRKKPVSVHERSELQRLVVQLDGNTDRMRHQQSEVAYLRDCVQQLLAEEEARLIDALKTSSPDGAARSPPAAHSPSASPSRPPAGPAAAAAARGRESQASYARPTPGLPDDDDDDVDWSVPTAPPPGAPTADGRPMTPTRLPAGGL